MIKKYRKSKWTSVLYSNEKEKMVNETAFERNCRLARKRANEKEKRVNETAFERNCRLAINRANEKEKG